MVFMGMGQHDTGQITVAFGDEFDIGHDKIDARGLFIAEGIESALTAARGISPVWAAVDAGGLSTFPVLAGIEALTIIADNDANGTGQAAADGCAKRWMEAGKEVRIWLPPIRGTDVNDWATS
jgi:phage/plasmid primase-like uncharacterized protein